MSKDLLKSFQEAYRNLELLPLSQQKDLNQFRVNYGGETIEELEQLVEDSPSSDGKIIFTGHRGCGKSTLLAEFSRQIDKRYFVVFFSIAETIEMSDVNHINILFAIGLNLMLEAEARQVAIPSSTKKALEQWFATRTRTEEKSITTEGTYENNIFKIISTKLKVDSTVRHEIKQEFERKISDLVAQLNIIAAAIQAVYKKDVLVIIIEKRLICNQN